MMSLSLRFSPVLAIALAAITLFAVQTVVPASARAEGTQAVKLAFGLPEGTVLHYKSFNQTAQNYSGTDVTANQTSMVDMSYAGAPDSTGTSPVDLKYLEIKSSLVMAGKLQDWSPPIKLEGATIRAFVSPKGEVERFEPGRNIPGMHSKEDLRDIVDAWFIDLPDTTVTVGSTWKRHIEQGKREEGPPELAGDIVYTLKKIEKHGDVEVAVIEGKATLKLNKETPAGTLVADGKVDGKAQVAVAGGYLIELKQDLEIRGNTVLTDPITDKETKRSTAMTQYTEIKLQQ
jgi:hypothetical protein